MDDRWDDSPRRAAARDAGPRTGAVRITPIRVVLALALVGALAFIAYSMLLVRDESAIPMLTAGALVLGIVSIAIGIAGAVAMNRASREGRDRNALLLSLFGGFAVVMGLFSFAGALVLALVLSG